MVKKYLLTFSLAAIGCLATKSIQSAVEVQESETEIVNSEQVELHRQASIYSAPKRTLY